MSGMSAWLGRQAPDVAATIRRFPLAITFLALGTCMVILLLNEIFTEDDTIAVRLAIGLLSGTAYAVAGVLFLESGQGSTALKPILAWVLPVLTVLGLQIEDTHWIVAPMIPIIGVLWMSVAGFTKIGKGAEQALQQDRFWWLNHRAVTIGVIAIVGFLTVAVGLYVIDRSLSFLFGVEIGDIFYKFVLPVAGLLLTPVYWLSMLPRVSSFESKDIDEPDFLSRAIGFLGQFVLSPLLVIYAFILIAYGVQIAVVGALPEGVLGWMVLVFIITGAANWLVLHPSFMHQRLSVRFFRRFWFWLTIIPLVLYATAVWVRIDAYGLTWERMALISGGLWAGLLTLGYLTRFAADIRLIPALAGALFVVLAVGPWNMLNAARWQQLSRLEGSIDAASGTDGSLSWTADNAERARGSIYYLVYEGQSEAKLVALLQQRGIVINADGGMNTNLVLDALGVPENVAADTGSFVSLEWLPENGPVALTGNSFLHAQLHINYSDEATSAGLTFQLKGTELRVWRDPGKVTTVSLSDWLQRQGDQRLLQPVIEFAIDDVRYRLVVFRASRSTASADDGGGVSIDYLQTILISSAEIQPAPTE